MMTLTRDESFVQSLYCVAPSPNAFFVTTKPISNELYCPLVFSFTQCTWWSRCVSIGEAKKHIGFQTYWHSTDRQVNFIQTQYNGLCLNGTGRERPEQRGDRISEIKLFYSLCKSLETFYSGLNCEVFVLLRWP